jgi:hypothetical protein
MALDDAEADAFAAVVLGAVVFGAALVPLLPQAATPAPSAQARRIPDSALEAFIEMFARSPIMAGGLFQAWPGAAMSRA